MSTFKDKRKNVYTVIVTNARTGGIELIETYSNKKHAEDRFARVEQSFVRRHLGTPHEGFFHATLEHTKLTRPSKFGW